MKVEPVAIAAAIVGAVNAVLGALVLLGVVTLSAEQLGGVVVAVQAVLAIPLTLWARAQVTPTP